MNIRLMTREDFPAFWPTFQSIVQAGETYAFDQDLSLEQGYRLWCETPSETWVAEAESELLGSYYIKPNARGPGNHVCNCGYMIAERARGRGLARKLCEHSQERALRLGFQAMQFNSVVATNAIAVALWEKLGYKRVGILPRAFNHPSQGLVDCYVMYKWLG